MWSHGEADVNKMEISTVQELAVVTMTKNKSIWLKESGWVDRKTQSAWVFYSSVRTGSGTVSVNSSMRANVGLKGWNIYHCLAAQGLICDCLWSGLDISDVIIQILNCKYLACLTLSGTGSVNLSLHHTHTPTIHNDMQGVLELVWGWICSIRFNWFAAVVWAVNLNPLKFKWAFLCVIKSV